MKKRRFAEGGGTSVDEDPIGGMDDFYSQSVPESSGEGPAVARSALPAVVRRGESEPAEITENRATFKESFADARRAGDKTFEWNGKKYSTDVAAPKAATPKESSTAAADFQRADKAAPKKTYQSLQDRAADYEAKRKESGVGMYGTRKSTSEPRGITKIDKSSMEPSGMGAIRARKPRGSEGYAKGGSVSSRADGCAQRGKTKGRMR